MKMVQVAIREYDDKWEVSFADGPTQWSPTAGGALNIVKARGQGLAERGESNAFVITWDATTATGLMVVKVLAGQERKPKPGHRERKQGR